MYTEFMCILILFYLNTFVVSGKDVVLDIAYCNVRKIKKSQIIADLLEFSLHISLRHLTTYNMTHS